MVGDHSLVEGIHDLFDAGIGDRLDLGLDSAFCDQMDDGVFRYDNVPPPPCCTCSPTPCRPSAGWA